MYLRIPPPRTPPLVSTDPPFLSLGSKVSAVDLGGTFNATVINVKTRSQQITVLLDDGELVSVGDGGITGNIVLDGQVQLPHRMQLRKGTIKCITDVSTYTIRFRQNLKGKQPTECDCLRMQLFPYIVSHSEIPSSAAPNLIVEQSGIPSGGGSHREGHEEREGEGGERGEKREGVDERAARKTGFEVLRVKDGNIAFFNHPTGTVTWQKPHVLTILTHDPLPFGWEKRIDPQKGIYFENYLTEEIRWTDPREAASPAPIAPALTENMSRFSSHPESEGQKETAEETGMKTGDGGETGGEAVGVADVNPDRGLVEDRHAEMEEEGERGESRREADERSAEDTLWELIRTDREDVLFVNHITRSTTNYPESQDMADAHWRWLDILCEAHTTWEHWFLFQNSGMEAHRLGPLPFGWEKKYIPGKGFYFINHLCYGMWQYGDPRIHGMVPYGPRHHAPFHEPVEDPNPDSSPAQPETRTGVADTEYREINVDELSECDFEEMRDSGLTYSDHDYEGFRPNAKVPPETCQFPRIRGIPDDYLADSGDAVRRVWSFCDVEKAKAIIKGIGSLTNLSSTAGQIESTDKIILFEANNFIDTKLTDLKQFFHEGFTFYFEADLWEDGKYVAEFVRPLNAQEADSLTKNANLTMPRMEDNDADYSLIMEKRAIDAVLGLFDVDGAIPPMKLSELQLRLEDVVQEDVMRYVLTSSLETFIKCRRHLFLLGPGGTFNLRHPSVFQCVKQLSEDLLSRGGVAEIVSLCDSYRSHKKLDLLMATVVQSPADLREFMEEHYWMFKVFPGLRHVSLRRNFYEYDYFDLVLDRFPSILERPISSAMFPPRTRASMMEDNAEDEDFEEEEGGEADGEDQSWRIELENGHAEMEVDGVEDLDEPLGDGRDEEMEEIEDEGAKGGMDDRAAKNTIFNSQMVVVNEGGEVHPVSIEDGGEEDQTDGGEKKEDREVDGKTEEEKEVAHPAIPINEDEKEEEEGKRDGVDETVAANHIPDAREESDSEGDQNAAAAATPAVTLPAERQRVPFETVQGSGEEVEETVPVGDNLIEALLDPTMDELEKKDEKKDENPESLQEDSDQEDDAPEETTARDYTMDSSGAEGEEETPSEQQVPAESADELSPAEIEKTEGEWKKEDQREKELDEEEEEEDTIEEDEVASDVSAIDLSPAGTPPAEVPMEDGEKEEEEKEEEEQKEEEEKEETEDEEDEEREQVAIPLIGGERGDRDGQVRREEAEEAEEIEDNSAGRLVDRQMRSTTPREERQSSANLPDLFEPQESSGLADGAAAAVSPHGVDADREEDNHAGAHDGNEEMEDEQLRQQLHNDEVPQEEEEEEEPMDESENGAMEIENGNAEDPVMEVDGFLNIRTLDKTKVQLYGVFTNGGEGWIDAAQYVRKSTKKKKKRYNDPHPGHEDKLRLLYRELAKNGRTFNDAEREHFAKANIHGLKTTELKNDTKSRLSIPGHDQFIVLFNKYWKEQRELADGAPAAAVPPHGEDADREEDNHAAVDYGHEEMEDAHGRQQMHNDDVPLEDEEEEEEEEEEEVVAPANVVKQSRIGEMHLLDIYVDVDNNVYLYVVWNNKDQSWSEAANLLFDPKVDKVHQKKFKKHTSNLRHLIFALMADGRDFQTAEIAHFEKAGFDEKTLESMRTAVQKKSVAKLKGHNDFKKFFKAYKRSFVVEVNIDIRVEEKKIEYLTKWAGPYALEWTPIDKHSLNIKGNRVGLLLLRGAILKFKPSHIFPKQIREYFKTMENYPRVEVSAEEEKAFIKKWKKFDYVKETYLSEKRPKRKAAESALNAMAVKKAKQ